MTDNLHIWNQVCRPPEMALKKIAGGRLSGMTDIKPQWRYKVMTEVFGPCGSGWSYDIVEKWTEQGPTGEVMAFIMINLKIKGYEYSIPGLGGSALIAKETAGLRASDEAYKMATTDALSVAMKLLGVGADIYMGLWDGSKYKAVEPQKITPEPVNEERVKTAASWLQKKIDEDNIEGNWSDMQNAYARLSNNERMAIDDIMKEKAPNSNKSYRNLLKEYLAYKPSLEDRTDVRTN